MLGRAGKGKKQMQRWAGKCRKRRFHRRNDIFYLGKMKQFGNSESVSNAADWLTIIQRRVRDFSSAKHQRTQPMKNVLGVF